ncbi:MAG: hypothetical protein IT322_14745 [Anaerolineae bacterium]|nr:hypothetical protein [Anaerolineae bacterium]
MFWEPADWITGIVQMDPLALLPLVPSAARFASHTGSPLRIGKKVFEEISEQGGGQIPQLTSGEPNRKVVVELFSGPTSQIRRDLPE